MSTKPQHLVQRPALVRRCTTHFEACPCREWRREQMESALRVIHTWATIDGGALDADHVADLCRRALAEPETEEATCIP